MTKTALILGASGRFGRTAAEAFWNAGWRVKSFDRSKDHLPDAADGADIIVNGWNPAYPEWAKHVPELTRQVIEAARASGATVIVPGNVYVYGQGAPQRFAEDTPHSAQNPLGLIRVRMEAEYRASDVPVIVLRGGDFLDVVPSGNWFDQIMIKGLPKGRLTYPGDPDVDHAWAFLPDMARAAVALAEQRSDLPRYCDVAFPGYRLTGTQLAEALQGVTGRHIKVQRMNWLPIWAAQPFWKMARHLIEMRYLWSKPHFLESQRFETLLPGFVHTPVQEALTQAIAHLDVQEPSLAPVTA